VCRRAVATCRCRLTRLFRPNCFCRLLNDGDHRSMGAALEDRRGRFTVGVWSRAASKPSQPVTRADPPATAATPRYGSETLVSARPDPQERAKHRAAGTAVDYAEGIRSTSPCSSRYRRCFQFFTAVPSRKSVVDERLMTGRPPI